MFRNIKQFFQGLAWPLARVDWNTRHHSRSYEAGITAQMVAFIGLPIFLLMGIGFLGGLWWAK